MSDAALRMRPVAIDALHVPLGDVLVPLAETHREALRAACAADPEVWAIYPHSMLGDAFDPAFDAMLGTSGRLAFAIVAEGVAVGCTSYWPDATRFTVEIGGTYIDPDKRGGGFNAYLKRAMIEHAFAQGFERLEFRVDTRNARSCRAVEKLGCTLDGVLRANRWTWTGFVRDTAVYSLLPGEWR